MGDISGPCCAHLTVVYQTEPVGNGAVRGFWACTLCHHKFVPSASYDYAQEQLAAAHLAAKANRQYAQELVAGLLNTIKSGLVNEALIRCAEQYIAPTPRRTTGRSERETLGGGAQFLVESSSAVRLTGPRPAHLTGRKAGRMEQMARFRKKPVVIEAVQFTQEVAERMLLDRHEGPFQLHATGEYNTETRQVYHANLCIHTLEGDMRADVGDWIIRGVKGELYPCKPDIFEATYEPAD